MRKITGQAAARFKQGTNWTNSNTSVDVVDTHGQGQIVTMYLHHNMIARSMDGFLYLTLAGWGTPTTRERLNGLLEEMGFTARFYQMKGQQFFVHDGRAVELEPSQMVKLTLNKSYTGV